MKLIEKMKIIKFILLTIICILLIIPLIYSFTFFNGFAGQIKSTNYPNDWYEINQLLNNDSQDFKVLFFPWHGYMDFRWVNNTDKRIANPARKFFDKETIIGTSIDIGDIYREDNSPEQLYIDSLINTDNNITNFGKLISILNVKYILLAKEADYNEYKFLFNQSDLELIKETENLYVLRNKNEAALIYQTDDINNIESKKIALDYEKISPLRYKLGDARKNYIVFTEPYNSDWKLDGKEPKKAYGVINVYENAGKELKFERFYKINLPAYIISLITFMILILIYFDFQNMNFKTMR